MNALMRLARRIPHPLLFGLAALVQVGLIAAMVVDRSRILREGQEVMLQTRPVDPRDLLRGDYVVLSYDISSVAAGALKDQPVKTRRSPVYVTLSPKADGFYEVAALSLTPVTVSGKDVLIRGRIVSGDHCGGFVDAFCDKLQINYGIERYFVPQGEGREIEHSRNEGKVAVVAAVTPAGRAAIKRLLIDGKPVYDEPLF
jgi:uncharacterized membrane-anchored protein